MKKEETTLLDQAEQAAPHPQAPAEIPANIAPWRAAVSRAQAGFTAIGSPLNFMQEAAHAIDILSKNDYLSKLDPKSIQDSVVAVAKLGLTLSPYQKLCYLIPRGGKCTLDVSYMGMIQILVESGAVKSIMAEVIRENDEWTYEPTSQPGLTHRIKTFDEKERGGIIAAYAKAVMPDGTVFIPAPLSISEINGIKARSESVKAGRQSPWTTDEVEMIKKTAIRRAYKLIPKTFNSELAQQRVETVNEIIDSDYKDVTPKKQDINQIIELD